KAMDKVVVSKDAVQGYMNNVSAVTEEVSASAEEIAATAEEQTASINEVAQAVHGLKKLATELKEILSFYKNTEEIGEETIQEEPGIEEEFLADSFEEAVTEDSGEEADVDYDEPAYGEGGSPETARQPEDEIPEGTAEKAVDAGKPLDFNLKEEDELK
ncbi:MAG: hypothetical protein ACOWWO_20205, partial [Peptococcaceae bacterium]